jgi:hypothetical protein
MVLERPFPPPSLSPLLRAMLLGAAVMAVLAVVVWSLAPQDLLVGTALGVFVATSNIADRVARTDGLWAMVILVGGGAWGFGAWGTQPNHALLWGMLLATALLVPGVWAARRSSGSISSWEERIALLQGLGVALMIGSWRLGARPITVVIIVALLAVGLAVLLIQVAALDDNDDPTSRAALLLSSVCEVVWNASVFVVLCRQLGSGFEATAPLALCGVGLLVRWWVGWAQRAQWTRTRATRRWL